ncbi:MltA domain-containing protein [Nodosilinea sp. LEGE 06152]|uniref:murein transglycosylase A n=1 Tax=Nodosilinea sp. LEGE 06152 TaxID=2777966 RepID=UPI00187E5963|nr:MltA domain-containing protein [Nodosilinea sp. LEGE 06152]MBE9157549.1 MltA domain-containing protein [Nodosilinea sp. LEGE 06152]
MFDLALPSIAVAEVSEDRGELVAELAPDAEAPAELPLRLLSAAEAEAVWPTLTLPDDRQALLQAINHSFTYLATPKAREDYQQHPVPGITRDRVWHSLQRLRQLVVNSPNNRAFQTALRRDFDLYASIGSDGNGTVAYTGYFEPQYRASTVPTAEYRYPLYRRPPTIETWPQPHPTRLELEGADGLAASEGPLAGLELVWLASRLEAFLVQVQGSAQLQLTNGQSMSVGYAGRTDYPYTSIGRALVNDGKIDPDNLSLPNLIAYFEAHPEDLDRYLPQNERFIFFREGGGGPPTGSLSVPVTAGYSIATDKALLPPGAIAAIQVPLPQQTVEGTWSRQLTTRLVLDQDTGGAILGPGRVDLFVGTGPQAGELAGRINTSGRLYYLLLRP